MSIAVEKQKQKSERFMLVRLEPGRYIEPVFLSGNNYTYTFDKPISKVQRNGVDLDLVTTISVTDQYSYNESTGILTVSLNNPPNASTNVIVIFYYLFYTGSKSRYAAQDPLNSATTLREWKPLLLNYPEIKQTFSNIISGVFTISESQITLINADQDFQNYMTNNDSFYNKDARVWLGISGVENLSSIFIGHTMNITMSKNTVTLNLSDPFNKLKQPAYMGDGLNDIVHSVANFPNIRPQDIGKICPYVFGSTTRYLTGLNYPGVSPQSYFLSEGLPAYCVDYSTTKTTATNRSYALCRRGELIATQTFGSVVRKVTLPSGLYAIKFTSYSNVQVGNTLAWYEGTQYYDLIYHVGEFTYLGLTYDIIIANTPPPSVGVFPDVGIKSIAVIVDTGGINYVNRVIPIESNKYLPLYGRDYVLASGAGTDSGNSIDKIVFNNNFEANISITMPTLDPDIHQVEFRFSQEAGTVGYKHGIQLRQMMIKSAVSHNLASFQAADTALPVNAVFQIPTYGSSEYETYLKYCEDVLVSTLGYFKINSNFEVEYHLLAVPAGTGTRDRNLMLEGSSGVDVEYQDMITKITGYNPHHNSSFARAQTNTPAATATSAKAKYLHSHDNPIVFAHTLEEISTLINRHLGIKSNRSATYKFETATQDIDSNLGDDVIVDSPVVLGGSESANVKIVTINKSPSKITIEATDLLGL